jgi:hypothetical protein
MKRIILIILFSVNLAGCKLLNSIIDSGGTEKPDTVKVYLTDTLEIFKIDTLQILKTDTLQILKTDTLQILKTDTLIKLRVDTFKIFKTDTLNNINFIDKPISDWGTFSENFNDSNVVKTYGVLYLDTLIEVSFEQTYFIRFNNIIYQLLKKEN